MDLTGLLVTFAILVIVVCVLWYLLQQLPLPPEAQKFITIALVVIIAIVVIGILLQFGGGRLRFG